MVTYKRVFETVFDWQTKQLFKKLLLMGGASLWEVVAMRVTCITISIITELNFYFNSCGRFYVFKLFLKCVNLTGILYCNQKH